MKLRGHEAERGQTVGDGSKDGASDQGDDSGQWTGGEKTRRRVLALCGISWKISGHLYRPFQPRLLALHQPVLVDIERTNLCSPTSICATLLRGQIRTRASSSLWHHVLVRCYDVIFFQSLPMPQNVGFLHQIFRMDQPEWVVGWNGW